MYFTYEDIILHLNKLLTFIEPVEELTNSHLVSFFTEDLWENKIPKTIQNELSNTESRKEFIQCYPNIIKNRISNEFRLKYPCLSSFILTATDISLRNNENLKLLCNVKEFFLTHGCGNYTDINMKEFMSKKKLHEVKVTSGMVACVSDLTKASHIVDIGGGKGYLSSILALQYSFKVLIVDYSQSKTGNTINRLQNVAKLWKGGIFEKDEFQRNEKINNKKARAEFIKKNCKQNLTFVTPETNVVKLLEQNFNDEIKGVTLTGLHTCGDLASTCLKIFLNTDKIKSIVNIGCCYHLINEEFLTQNFFEVGCNETVKGYGFPLSNFLKKKKFVLGREAKLLAEQSLDRINSQLKDGCQVSLLYRAIVETVIQTTKQCEVRQSVGDIGKKAKNFKEYMYKALEKLDIKIQFTEEDLDKMYDQYKGMETYITAFFLIRATLAPVLESIILLDRLLYLNENGIRSAVLVQLFDLEISPRGFGIVAWKDFEKG